MEWNNGMVTWADKGKHTLSVYDIKGKEKTLSMSEKKEKARDGCVCIYQCSKQLCTSTSKRACAAQKMTTIYIKEMLESLNYETKELCATNRDLWTYIDSCHKEPERHATYPEHSTAHFNNVANITVNIDSITLKNKQNKREEYRQKDFHISFDKNEENKSIIASKTI